MVKKLLTTGFVAGLAACGGGSGDEEVVPLPVPSAELRIQTIMIDRLRIVGSSGQTLNVSSTVLHVGVSGSIKVEVAINWSNSADGAGSAFPEGIDCTNDPGPFRRAKDSGGSYK